MTEVVVRCLYCGPFEIADDLPAVEQLHAHAAALTHQELVALDAELEEKVR